MIPERDENEITKRKRERGGGMFLNFFYMSSMKYFLLYFSLSLSFSFSLFFSALHVLLIWEIVIHISTTNAASLDMCQ